MKHHFITTLFILFSFLAVGQIDTVKNNTNIFGGGVYVEKARLTLQAYGLANSNSITGNMIQAFIKGGYIDDATKSTTLPRLKKRNRFGSEGGYSVSFEKFIQKDNSKITSYFINYRENFFLSSAFVTNDYKLLFFGNKQFEGQTIPAAPFSLFFQTQRSLGGGISIYKPKSVWRVGANIIQGTQNTTIKVTDAELFTATDGQSVDLYGKFSVKQSAGPRYKAGYGFGLEGSYTAPLKENVTVSIMAENIGLLFWNKNSENYSRDTSVSFSGLNLNHVLQGDSAWTATKDSLKAAFNPSHAKTRYTSVLPFFVQLNFTIYKNKWTVRTGLNYRHLPGNWPKVYVETAYSISKVFTPFITLQYGGYGGFNTGIGMRFNTNNGYSFYIESLYNEGWIAPKKASGLGVMLKLSKSFRSKK